MPFNIFDAVVVLVLIIGIVSGFTVGLVRSMAAILAYLAAAPLALALAPRLIPLFAGSSAPSWERNSLLLFGVFIVLGMVLGKLLRTGVDALIGPDVGILDRFFGACLGAVRVGLIAVTVVLIFDRIIPADRQPAFLIGSKLRPFLSLAAQMGLKSLPPDLVDRIDQLKRERGIP